MRGESEAGYANAGRGLNGSGVIRNFCRCSRSEFFSFLFERLAALSKQAIATHQLLITVRANRCTTVAFGPSLRHSGEVIGAAHLPSTVASNSLHVI